ncbi:hypothetical protein E2562_020543 [Oryza meyeriana var. granulata]|uniref:Uncharacterized protein n=1 Tax=Oryza meyeriana var. granulata TaxID=110450 RepID=A0A6G1E9Z2_9ORYZ|nr:hypothetical protein E2562_020543 [Oryza meyeriana var. granulata]
MKENMKTIQVHMGQLLHRLGNASAGASNPVLVGAGAHVGDDHSVATIKVEMLNLHAHSKDDLRRSGLDGRGWQPTNPVLGSEKYCTIATTAPSCFWWS